MKKKEKEKKKTCETIFCRNENKNHKIKPLVLHKRQNVFVSVYFHMPASPKTRWVMM